MKTHEIEMIRTDKIKVELDPEFFNEKWFEEFRSYMYDLYTLEELAEHIAYNIVENNSIFIEGVGTPLRNGKQPLFATESDLEKLEKHANVIYRSGATEHDIETRKVY